MSGIPAGEPASFLVHGMGTDRVEPVWPPLDDEEVASVLGEVPQLAGSATASALWRSPRPFSATGIVELASGPHRRLVIKRHHGLVRSVAELTVEHRFLAHLAERHRLGACPAVPRPIAVVSRRPWHYEVLAAAGGEDLYQDAFSWTPYRSDAHAAVAGAALARLHVSCEGFEEPGRRLVPLMSSSEVVIGDDLVSGIEHLLRARPALRSYLATRPWRDDVRRHLAGWHEQLLPARARLVPSWAHGDWHPSNLLWSGSGSDRSAVVSGAIDFGLSNRTSALHDLATAIERSAVNWLEPAPRWRGELGQLAALLAGYESVRPLGPADRDALSRLLPLVHVEYALSEVEYFHAVVGTDIDADLAYETYLLAHADFFATPAGAEMLSLVAGRGPHQSSGTSRTSPLETS